MKTKTYPFRTASDIARDLAELNDLYIDLRTGSSAWATKRAALMAEARESCYSTRTLAAAHADNQRGN